MTAHSPQYTAILMALALAATGACGNSSDTGGGGNNNCNVTLSGAQTASLDCLAPTVVWSAAENMGAVGIEPDGPPRVLISFGVPGQLATTSYHSTDPGLTVGLSITDGTNTKQWLAGAAVGAPATASATLTITSLSTTSSNADGKIYAAHGKVTATLEADPASSATGTVTLNATF